VAVRGRVLYVLALAATLAGCQGSGEIPTLLSGRIVMPDGSPHVGVMIVMERGPLNVTGALEHGVLTGEDGRFTVEVPGGGEWGLHVYVSPQYLYIPLEMYLLPNSHASVTQAHIAWTWWEESTGQDVELDWPVQPDDPGELAPQPDGNRVDNPEVWDPRCERLDEAGEYVRLCLEASDRNDNLTQIIAYNTRTGRARMMTPLAGSPVDKRYPNGSFTVTDQLEPAERATTSTWLFTAADFTCNNAQVIRYGLRPQACPLVPQDAVECAR